MGLLYAFGPARDTQPGAAEASGLTATDGSHVGQSRVTSIADGRWPLIHVDAQFDPDEWPTLRVVRRALGANRLFELEWVDGNQLSHPLGKVSDEEAAEEAAEYPPDAWHGPEGYMIAVSERLDARQPPSQRATHEPPPASLFHEDDAADWLADELLDADTLQPVHAMLTSGTRMQQPLGIAIELRAWPQPRSSQPPPANRPIHPTPTSPTGSNASLPRSAAISSSAPGTRSRGCSTHPETSPTPLPRTPPSVPLSRTFKPALKARDHRAHEVGNGDSCAPRRLAGATGVAMRGDRTCS